MDVFLTYVLPVLLFVAALVLIIKGGDYLVNSAIWMAKVTKIPQMIIGATVVSIVTTLPEVLVSTFATALGTGEGAELAVGNAAGSMIFNVLVILGISAMLAPTVIGKKSFREKGLILLLFTAMLVVFAVTGARINVWEGVVLLVMFAAFIAFNVYDAMRNKRLKLEPECTVDIPEHRGGVWILLFLIGAAAIGVGAKLLVDNGMKIATNLGVSKEIVGLTFVAAGTSLPELVTTITSIKKNTGAIGIGNILGANIINCTLLVGLCGVMNGNLTMTVPTLLITLPVLLLSAFMLVIPTFFKGKTYRAQGIAMLGVFLVYLTVMILLELGIIPPITI